MKTTFHVILTTAVDGVNATIAVTPGANAATVVVTIPKSTNPKLFAHLKVINP